MSSYKLKILLCGPAAVGKTSLIQTFGRAARHSEGHVIMYADSVTGSMDRAIKETKRRRKYQQNYNKKYGITPTSISKEIKESRLRAVSNSGVVTDYIPAKTLITSTRSDGFL